MKRQFTVTVNGQKFDVAVVEKDAPGTSAAPAPAPVKAQPVAAPAKSPAVTKAVSNESPKAGAATGQGKSAKAPMPGKIIALLVKEGDMVDRGQPLLVLEAMKLENDIVAPQAGKVEKILVKVGQSVGNSEELIVIS